MKDYWKEVWNWTWPWIAMTIFVVSIVVYIKAPKCYACRHFSHKNVICGTYMRDGNCVCREDR